MKPACALLSRSLLVFFFVFVALPCAAAPADDAAHVDPEWGFRIEKPDAGWAYFEEKGSPAAPGFTLKIYPVGTSGEIMTQVTVKPLAAGADADPKRGLEESRALVAGKAEYTEFTPVTMTVAGREAPGFSVRYQDARGPFLVRQLFLVENGFRYLIQAHAPADRFAEFEPAFTKARDSFRFVPVTAAATDAAKIRELAARCGSELDWAPTWEAAAARAAKEKKPVLVVVHAYPGFSITDETMTGTFMDPDIVDLVRERFVPCRFSAGDTAPFAALDGPYGLGPHTFGEALLVVSEDGRVLEETGATHEVAAYAFLVRALERHPRVGSTPPSDPSPDAHLARASLERKRRHGDAALAEIEKARASAAGAPLPAIELEAARIHLRLGNAAAARTSLDAILASDPLDPEAIYWSGVLELSAKGASAAKAAWAPLIEKRPESRWAWKAAADLESTRLAMGMTIRPEWPPEEVLAAFDARERAPLDRARARDADRDGLEYLLRAQRANGSWIGSSALEGESDSVPDPLTDAVIAIAGKACLDRAARSPEARAAASRALDRVLAAHDRAKSAPEAALFMDYRPWSRTFVLFFLSAALDAGLGDAARVRETAAEVVAAMAREKNTSGGWTYYVTGDVSGGGSKTPDHAMSFVTAAAVLSLFRAREAKIDVPKALLDGALDRLERMRRSDGIFEYLQFADAKLPSPPTGRGGASGRAPVCELALFRGGRSTRERVASALDAFVADRAELEKQLGKALMHAGPDAQGCHYLLFDYAFAAAALREAPKARREKARRAIAEFVLRARCADGSFLDTPILGPASGTGLALWALGSLD